MSSSGPGQWGDNQNWIKDVLSKSGTDLMEVKGRKGKKDQQTTKMVYYQSLPLIVKTEVQHHQQQICSKMDSNADTRLYQPSNLIVHHQPKAPAPTVNMATLPNGTLLIPTSQHRNYSASIKMEPNEHEAHKASVQPKSKATTPKPQFKCEQCGMTFGSKSAHTSHMKSHMKQDNNFITSSSNGGVAVTAIPPTPQITANANSGGDPYQCNVCQKTFAVPARLIRHYRTHTGERPFKCEFCDKMFSVKENLQVHRRIHTKERPYKCDVCGRAFEHSGKLHRHMRIHTGERPHKCSVCGKTFIQSGQLVIHMRTHTGEKPYKCPVEGCGKGFTCSKQLKVHSRTHTGEKPYHCDICKRDFGYNHVLKLHRVQHYGSKCYKCTICDETFKSKKEMEAHIKGHANEIPDDEEEQQSQLQPQSTSPNTIKQEITYRDVHLMHHPSAASPPLSSSSSTTSTSIITQETEQSRDSGIAIQQPQHHVAGSTPPMAADAIGADDDLGYASVYQHQRYQSSPSSSGSVSSSYASMQPFRATINPVLLDAASIASRQVEEEAIISHQHSMRLNTSSSSAVSSESNDDESSRDNELSVYYKNAHNLVGNGYAASRSPDSLHLDSLEVLRQRGYFPPAPVAEFRSSLCHTDIVRQVEAAIAGAGLSPPRSSPTDSPDRSSSPESDTMLMADRDVMTLPLRKRKLYMSDNQSNDVQQQVMRMSSVIQFAKAS